MSNKRCSSCDLEKPTDQFGRNKSRPDGFHSQCRKCRSAYSTGRAHDDPTRVKERAWWKALPSDHPVRTKSNLTHQDLYYRNKSTFQLRNRIARLKRYGLTITTWDEILKAQNYCCAICGATEPGGRDNGTAIGGKPPNWHTDHDAAIGPTAVRGLLCARCNLGLGWFKHDSALMAKAIAYLSDNLHTRKSK